jgi:hypothetical protein
MATAHFTEYEVRQLLEARKFVSRVLQDNLKANSNPNSEKHIVYDVRRMDMPRIDIRLRLCARLAPSISGVGAKATPGVALQWKGKLIRRIDHALRHDSIRHGVSVGHLKGWHEHIWTDEDEDSFVITADPPVTRSDIRSLIQWAAEKWNIDLGSISKQMPLGS